MNKCRIFLVISALSLLPWACVPFGTPPPTTTPVPTRTPIPTWMPTPTVTPTPEPTTGEISGRVIDPTDGSVIPYANISTNPPTSSVTADAQGRYTISDMLPGYYTITAIKPGYVTASVEVVVAAGRTTTADLHLISDTTSIPTPTGSMDFALQFDGDDDCVELGRWFDLPAFTISLWVKPGSWQKTAWANIIDNNHTDYRAWVIQQDEFQNNRYLWGSCSKALVTYFDLSPGVWHHIVVVRDISESRVYLDDMLVRQTVNMPTVNYDGTQVFHLGCWGGGDRHWTGQMDELQVWDRALSSEQVEDLTNRYLTGQEDGLVAYYHFDEGAGQTVHDSSVNGYDGTLIGDPSWIVSQRSE